MSNHHSRRDILKGALGSLAASAYSNPIKFILSSIVSSVIKEVHAQESGELMNLVSIRVAGGLHRIHFDSILKPFKTSAFVDNLGVRTKFNVLGMSTDASYETTDVGPYQFPWLWESKLPANEGVIAMKRLADNMLTIRGFDSLIDGHEPNLALTIKPVAGKSSIHGLNAEQADYLFPAVMKGGFNFVSTMGSVSHSFSNGDGALNSLFNPYYRNTLDIIENPTVETAVDELIQKIKARYATNNKDMDILYKNREKIITISRKAIDTYNDEFVAIVNRYKGIISRVASGHLNGLALEGLDDKPLYGDSRNPLWRIQYRSKFAAQIDSGLHDLTARITEATNNDLAYGLAMAEFLISKKYSNTFNISTGLISDFYRNAAYMADKVGALAIDQHATGSYGALYYNSKGYQIFSAALLEFIRVLKEKNKFNDTLIWLTSEFARSPRADGSGSDHGYNCQAESFWSGSIQGPQVIGNIRANSGNAEYPGTYGVAAPFASNYGIGLPTNKNVFTSILTMLKITPFLNNPPLVTWDRNNKIISTTGAPENV